MVDWLQSILAGVTPKHNRFTCRVLAITARLIVGLDEVLVDPSKDRNRIGSPNVAISSAQLMSAFMTHAFSRFGSLQDAALSTSETLCRRHLVQRILAIQL